VNKTWEGYYMRVGLIGCGGASSAHIKIYKKIKNVDVVSLCDINIEKAKIFARNFKVEKTYTNYWDMFDKEDLDLVDVGTPVSTHAKIVCDAAKASLPAILVEKPMALNVAECDEMIKEAKKHGSKLCIGHNQIFLPDIQKIKSMVNNGDFNLFSFKTSLRSNFEMLRAYNLAPAWNVMPEQKGIIWEVGCHHAYLQLYFLPDIQEVYAVGSKVLYPVYDDFTVILRTSKQQFGIIEISWITRETEAIYEFRDITGRKLAVFPWEFNYMLEYSQEPPFTIGKVAKNIFVDQKRLIQKWLKFVSCYIQKRKILPTFNLINTFIESIKKDLPPPVQPEDGRKTIKLLECIETSLNEKRPVKTTF
jgi:predicted dehydrogenase